MNIHSPFKDFYDYVNPPNKEDKIFHRRTFVCSIPNRAYQHGKKEIDINKAAWDFVEDIDTFQKREKITYVLNIGLSNYLMDLINNTRFVVRHFKGRYSTDIYYQWYLCICGVMYRFVRYKDDLWAFEDAPKEVLDKFRSFFLDMSDIDWVTNYQTNLMTVELHRVFNTPVFMISSNYAYTVDITLNPNLLGLGLSKLLDKVKVHQDIDMFINNILVKQDDPNIAMSEEDKLASKGMDKWSFRQVGPKNRKRK